MPELSSDMKLSEAARALLGAAERMDCIPSNDPLVDTINLYNECHAELIQLKESYSKLVAENNNISLKRNELDAQRNTDLNKITELEGKLASMRELVNKAKREISKLKSDLEQSESLRKELESTLHQVDTSLRIKSLDDLYHLLVHMALSEEDAGFITRSTSNKLISVKLQAQDHVAELQINRKNDHDFLYNRLKYVQDPNTGVWTLINKEGGKTNA